MTIEELAIDVDQSVRSFAAVTAAGRTGSGIPQSPQITTEETVLEPQRFSVQFRPTELETGEGEE